MECKRREFLAAAAGAALVAGRTAPRATANAAAIESGGEASLRVRPRYHRWHVDPGVEWVETNTGYARLDWTIPLRRAAVVLLDVWDRHYLKDTQARADAIIEERFVPLLAGCRKAGLTIIHAPSPPQAMQHPNWIGAGRASPVAVDDARSPWPPVEFRSKAGEFSVYARPAEPREPELRQLRASLQIHPRVLPVGNEAVVATGDELHEYCRSAGILFLFFAGFNTNACILVRDYGTLAMSARGYEVILLRDCTTGMESAATQPTLSQTQGAILLLEMFGQYTVTSEELLSGLQA